MVVALISKIYASSLTRRFCIDFSSKALGCFSMVPSFWGLHSHLKMDAAQFAGTLLLLWDRNSQSPLGRYDISTLKYSGVVYI